MDGRCGREREREKERKKGVRHFESRHPGLVIASIVLGKLG
jgi:hypothetical protein